MPRSPTSQGPKEKASGLSPHPTLLGPHDPCLCAKLTPLDSLFLSSAWATGLPPRTLTPETLSPAPFSLSLSGPGQRLGRREEGQRSWSSGSGKVICTPGDCSKPVQMGVGGEGVVEAETARDTERRPEQEKRLRHREKQGEVGTEGQRQGRGGKDGEAESQRGRERRESARARHRTRQGKTERDRDREETENTEREKRESKRERGKRETRVQGETLRETERKGTAVAGEKEREK